MQRQLYIDEAHMALDIFRFAVSISLGDALTTVAVQLFFTLAFDPGWKYLMFQAFNCTMLQELECLPNKSLKRYEIWNFIG